ncbi:peptidase C39 [Luteolibacter yonseiensis]|uniref:Peptidase C39 n=1 Tax=Luteolibacter yonseiensis TaxID=1144680 RepID=A0A934V733_9BACT|nr:RHS repeat-associated core domain-containing protein [Luteolibacter yonseiensis]MBK1815707.1 peptidase C39 [Luteolibacter yonseiensis]
MTTHKKNAGGSLGRKAIALILIAAVVGGFLLRRAEDGDSGQTADHNPSGGKKEAVSPSAAPDTEASKADNFQPVPNVNGVIPAPAAVKASEKEELEWTANARPTDHTSLLLLDLSRIPSEKDLRMAGQLGEELIPTRSAEPSQIEDLALRSKQEQDNLSFGKAIQDWNLHNYEKACELFNEHLKAFPESAWAAEAELHLGCYAQYNGRFDEAKVWFEASEGRSPKGHSMHAKSTLRLGALAMESGSLQEATLKFTSLRATSDTSSHGTYASYWITRLSLMKDNSTSMRDCAQKSLAEICSLLEKPEAAARLRAMENTRPEGFSLQEIEDLAKEQGLTARTIITTAPHAADLPVPFIAHYGLGEQLHFVAVLSHAENGKMRIYDSRTGGVTDADETYFKRQWSGYATLFAEVPDVEGILLASAESKRTVVGGCCGYPKMPDDLVCGIGENAGGCGPCSRGMPSWSVNPVNMNLTINDTPMWWDAPYGPSVNMSLTYNSLDSLATIRPFGDKWTFAYSAYAMQDPSGAVLIMYGNGYNERYTRNADLTFTPEARNAQSKLTKTGNFTFVVEDGNGTKHTFSVSKTMAGASAASLLTSIVDKYGTAVNIAHNGQGAVTAITHSAGGTWNLYYNAAGKVRRITDPFSREATFTYDSNNRLTGQTDQGGVAYGYGYTTAARVRERDPLYPDFGHTLEYVERTNELFINALNLPTGTYLFDTEPADGINNMGLQYADYAYPPHGGKMWENYRITVTDPMAQKEEYYFDGASKKGWHRSKRHFKMGQKPDSGEPHKLYEFALAGGRGQIKKTRYPGGGQSVSDGHDSSGRAASVTGADGQVTKYTYNTMGNVTIRQEGEDGDLNKIIYTTTYAANGIDPTSETRTVGGVVITLSQITYNSSRDVQSQTNSFGVTTAFTRNSKGQLLTETHPLVGLTERIYDTNGRLYQVKNTAPGQTVAKVKATCGYDGVGRVVSEMDEEGHLLNYEYDLLNRLVKTIYPDTTYTQSNYSCCTLTSQRARDGSVTQYTYDALKRLVNEIKPGGESITRHYDQEDNMTVLNFGRGEGVSWSYDAANRVTAKFYPDGKKLTYGYDAQTGQMTWSRDSQNRETTYGYDAKGRIVIESVSGRPIQKYTYDAVGLRIKWEDGTAINTYSYDPHDRIVSSDGPLDHDTFTYQYDSYGRKTSFTYDGAEESYTYDNLGRIATITNPLGTFANVYDGETGKVSEFSYPLSGMKTVYQRLPVAQGGLLGSITHHAATIAGGGVLASYQYGYNSADQITTWQQTQPGISPRQWNIGYDARRQVAAITEQPLVGTPPILQKVWRYRYDASGNRIAAQENNQVNTAAYNNLNQLVSLKSGGSTWFRGKVNEPAQVTFAGKAATIGADGSFEALVETGPGTQDVAVQAKDQAGNIRSETWRVSNGSAVDVVPTYDAEGNNLTDGRYSYTWDVSQRMTGVSTAQDNWTFTYDGARRRTSEAKNGVSQRRWVWNGTQMFEERLANGVKHRFWTGGIQIVNSSGQAAGKRYIVKDHLGSTRAVVDGTTGVATASYDYAPWGRRSRVQGTEDWGLGYTGHWQHESGLSLSVYRAYDPDRGRWASRDPIQEDGGLNLTAYCDNDVINKADVLGLAPATGRWFDSDGKVHSSKCMIIVYVGHNGEVPQSGNIVDSDCSASVVISCGQSGGDNDPARPDTVPDLPPIPRGGEKISEYDLSGLIKKVVAASEKHAKTICMNKTCCCKWVTIVVRYVSDLPATMGNQKGTEQGRYPVKCP